jgi:A/G-specific adenine glycosylase
MRRAGDFNQALIELGAIVCVPNGPAKCSECPVAHLCEARKHDIVMELPKKASKKARSIENKTVMIIKDGEKIAIRKRPDKGLLAGLYELPNVEGSLSEEEVLRLVKSYGLTPLFIQKLEDSKHIFTHKEWHMNGYAVRVAELEGETEGMLFVERQTVEKEYPIPSAFAAYAKHMDIVLGNKR